MKFRTDAKSALPVHRSHPIIHQSTDKYLLFGHRIPRPRKNDRFLQTIIILPTQWRWSRGTKFVTTFYNTYLLHTHARFIRIGDHFFFFFIGFSFVLHTANIKRIVKLLLFCFVLVFFFQLNRKLYTAIRCPLDAESNPNVPQCSVNQAVAVIILSTRTDGRLRIIIIVV